MPRSPFPAMPAWARGFAADLATCLGFFSRLPVPSLWFEAMGRPGSGLASALRALPLAGLLIGCCSAVALPLGDAAGLPSGVVAILATILAVLATGGLHEDGLADMADGFGGGATRAAKLAIMRDSRIGTYGVLAVCLALLLRVGCLASILDRGGAALAVSVILASSAVSRALAILPLVMLPPARADGLGRAAGTPDRRNVGMCFGMATGLGLLPLLAGADLPHAVLACCLAALASVAVVGLARRHIGGHTGDVGGASQQASEILYLLGILLFPALR